MFGLNINPVSLFLLPVSGSILFWFVRNKLVNVEGLVLLLTNPYLSNIIIKLLHTHPGGPGGPGGPVGPGNPFWPSGPLDPGLPLEPVLPGTPLAP